MPGEKAAAAGHIQPASRRKSGDQIHQLGHLLMPTGPCALGEAALAEVPLVVLAGAQLVVRRGRRVTRERGLARAFVLAPHELAYASSGTGAWPAAPGPPAPGSPSPPGPAPGPDPASASSAPAAVALSLSATSATALTWSSSRMFMSRTPCEARP